MDEYDNDDEDEDDLKNEFATNAFIRCCKSADNCCCSIWLKVVLQLLRTILWLIVDAALLSTDKQ